jgi:hypothetical protein
VAQTHDDVAGLGGDFEFVGKAVAVDDQRVVPRGLEGRRHVLEHALARVANARELAVHWLWCPHHLAAEYLPDRLVAEADAEHRQLGLGRRLDEVHADTGLVGRAGAWREHDGAGFERQRLLDADLVVAVNGAARAEIAQEVDEVVGEAVVVIDEEEHGSTYPLMRR